jgi:hypothetical protein
LKLVSLHIGLVQFEKSDLVWVLSSIGTGVVSCSHQDELIDRADGGFNDPVKIKRARYDKVA